MSDTKELLQKGGGPGGSDIFVDPAALHTVANEFRARLQAFAARHQAFAAGTPHRGGEFGKLPLSETHRVNDQYVKTQADAVKSLQDLAGWLDQMAAALSISEAIYNGSDGRAG
jgi:hypothetical protein